MVTQWKKNKQDQMKLMKIQFYKYITDILKQEARLPGENFRFTGRKFSQGCILAKYMSYV